MASQRANRRLAAILAADVAGYSGLVERDEAGTLARLATLRDDVIEPALAEHRGRLVKLIGDGVLAEFGSVVDAVACAIDIQQRNADGLPCASESISATSWPTATTSMVTGSMLPRGSKAWPSIGGVVVSGTAWDHCTASSGCPSRAWASSGSRTSPGPSAPTGSPAERAPAATPSGAA